MTKARKTNMKPAAASASPDRRLLAIYGEFVTSMNATERLFQAFRASRAQHERQLDAVRNNKKLSQGEQFKAGEALRAKWEKTQRGILSGRKHSAYSASHYDSNLLARRVLRCKATTVAGFAAQLVAAISVHDLAGLWLQIDGMAAPMIAKRMCDAAGLPIPDGIAAGINSASIESRHR